MLGLYCILPVWVAFLCAYIYELILPIKKKHMDKFDSGNSTIINNK
jgi:hypothetical protein